MATLYAAKAASATTSDLYTLDPSTAVASSVGATGHAFTALAFDPTDDTLYGITSPGSAADPKSLFTIDPDTGAATLVGALSPADTIADIAFDSTGQMYGYGGTTGQIHVIDKTDGSHVELAGGALGLSPSAAALTFGPDDTLYLIARVSGTTSLYVVDTTTSTPTLVGDLTPFSSHFPSAATFGEDGQIWWFNGGGGGSGVRLRTCDPSTGAWVVVGTSSTDPGDNFDGLTWSGAAAAVSFSRFTRIKFGTGLKVTDEGGGVIRVDVV